MHTHQRSLIGSYVVLALSCLVFIHPGAEARQARMKVVLDTDIGTDIDDAWALGYALKSPSFELLGVTVSDGDTRSARRLACKLLDRLGRTDVPGRGRPADTGGAAQSRRLPVHLGGGFPRVHAGRDAGGGVPRRRHPPEPGRNHARSPSVRCRTSAISFASIPMSCRWSSASCS